MMVLPIVIRELRVATRHKRTYQLRTWAAGAMVAISGLFFLAAGPMADPQRMGHALFQILNGGLWVWCLFVGLALTADCLSEEKRAGTLGLLFLTDLKGYDVVLGKLTTHAIKAFYSLIAVLPVLALPLLLGGVSLNEFLRLTLVLVNTLFLSLSIGLGVSALSRQARKALGVAVLVMLGFTAGAPVLGAWWSEKTHQPLILEVVALPSPGWAYYSAFDHAYRARPVGFWASNGVIHALAWAWLGLACRTVRNTWQDRPKATVGPWIRLRQRWTLGRPKQRERLRQTLLAVNPYLWRVERQRWKSWVVWLGPVVVALVWIVTTLKEGSNWIGPPAYFTTAILLMIWIKLGIAVEAGQAFCEDRRSGTLALLLTTPLTVREIVRGQGLALRRQFLGPLGMTLGVSFLFLLLTLADHSVSDEHFGLTALWVALMVLLVADSLALAILGMWMGLKHRNINRAAGATISRLLVLPWMIYILGIRALPWALYATGISSILWADLYSGWFFLGLWFFPGLLADALFGVWAWRKLHEEFRRAVGEPLPAAVPWWRVIAQRFRRPPSPPASPQ